jgi:hypothetical protein
MIKLLVDANGAPGAMVDDRAKVELASLATGGPTNIGGVIFSAAADPCYSLGIMAQEKEAVVEAADFPGWAVRVRMGSRGDFNPDFKAKRIALLAPASNPADLTVRFPVQGGADISAGVSTRFELFGDQSYYFTASSNVFASTADDQGMILTSREPPLLGGPLIVVTNTQQGAYRQRLLPKTEVIISGDLTSDLTVAVGKERYPLPLDGRQTIALPNGTRFELVRSMASRTLRWRVEKGCVLFSIADIENWQAWGQSGQSASMQWDTATQVVDITNLTPVGDGCDNPIVLVHLSGRLYVSVSPQAVFQYMNGRDLATFSTSAAGGVVVLYNAELGMETRLDTGNLVFNQSGIPASTMREIRGPRHDVYFLGESGVDLRFRGDRREGGISEELRLPLNQQASLRRERPGEETAVLDLSYASNGELSLRAAKGNFTIHPQDMVNWRIDLPEGSSMTMVLDMRHGLFCIRSNSDNPAGVGIHTPMGYKLPVSSGSAVSFFLAQDAEGPGTMVKGVFFESSGAGQDVPFGSAPVGSRSRPTGRSAAGLFGTRAEGAEARIPQTPISTPP